jgi:transketolase
VQGPWGRRRRRRTLIGAAVSIRQCLLAIGELAADGIAARVVELYSVKLLDVAALRHAAAVSGGRLVVAEDRYRRAVLARPF